MDWSYFIVYEINNTSHSSLLHLCQTLVCEIRLKAKCEKQLSAKLLNNLILDLVENFYAYTS